MREDYYPNEYRFSREDYYPLGYRDDEEMCVYDQCCENCARQGCDCPFEDDDIDAANAASLSNKLLQMANERGRGYG